VFKIRTVLNVKLNANGHEHHEKNFQITYESLG